MDDCYFLAWATKQKIPEKKAIAEVNCDLQAPLKLD
jgi:hypothetical protein